MVRRARFSHVASHILYLSVQYFGNYLKKIDLIEIVKCNFERKKGRKTLLFWPEALTWYTTFGAFVWT